MAGASTAGGGLRLPPPRIWLPPVVAFGLAQLVRHVVVEPPRFQHLCDPAPWAGWCLPRSVLIQTFATQGLGWLALAAGIVALLSARGSRLGLRAAQVALASGAAGLVLYCFEPATVGVLLAAVALARPGAGPAAGPAGPESGPDARAAG